MPNSIGSIGELLMKKILMVVFCIFLLAVPVFASDTVNIKWTWLLEDPEVNYYRYQLDAMDPSGWIVVGGTVSSYQIDDIDAYVDHTLYLECSYDGINWSETASLTAPAKEKEVAPVAEEAAQVVEEVAEEAGEEVVIEEIIEEIIEEEPIVEEIAPIAPVKKVKEDTPFVFSLLLKGGLSQNYSSTFEYNPEYHIGVIFDFANIIPTSKTSGFGLRVDADYLTTDFSDAGLDATLLLTYNARAGIANFEIGVGIGTTITNTTESSLITTSTESLTSFGNNGNVYLYTEALFGVRFYIGDNFSIGLEAFGRMYIPDWEKWRYGANVVFGYSF